MARIILQMSLQSKQCYLSHSHHSLTRIEVKGKENGCGGRRDDLGRCRGQELETYLAVKAIMNELRSDPILDLIVQKWCFVVVEGEG